MISYNNKEWFTFVFRLYKADTLRKLLPLIISISVYTSLVTVLELYVLKLPENAKVRNLSQMHALLSFVISLLLVFRTNSAYDRWYEGRKLWGQLVNNSRNLAIKLNAMLDPSDEDNRRFFKRAIPLFALSLHQHLRRQTSILELDESSDQEVIPLDKDKQVPNQIASLIMKRINLLYTQGKISGDQLIIMDGEMRSFMDIAGACERIKNTPIPFSYSVFLKKFIFFFVMTLPFSYVFMLGWGAVPVVAFIFFVLASLELIAEEIEDPFTGDQNDLPTQRLAENIKIHVIEIIE